MKQHKILKELKFNETEENSLSEKYESIFGQKQYLEFIKILKKESDRGAILVTLSVIDNILESIIRKHCSVGNKKDIQRLFDFSGPFNNLSSKVLFLSSIGKLTSTFKTDIDILRKIRNDLAHRWSDFEINDTFSKRYYSKFKSMDFINNISKSLGENLNMELELTPRATFDTLASVTISLLSVVDKGT